MATRRAASLFTGGGPGVMLAFSAAAPQAMKYSSGRSSTPSRMLDIALDIEQRLSWHGLARRDKKARAKEKPAVWRDAGRRRKSKSNRRRAASLYHKRPTPCSIHPQSMTCLCACLARWRTPIENRFAKPP
jgi:hypothetical protein